jgi:hypothetical protein
MLRPSTQPSSRSRKGRPELWQWTIIFVVEAQQNTNPTYSLGLLRTRGKGPFRG